MSTASGIGTIILLAASVSVVFLKYAARWSISRAKPWGIPSTVSQLWKKASHLPLKPNLTITRSFLTVTIKFFGAISLTVGSMPIASLSSAINLVIALGSDEIGLDMFILCLARNLPIYNLELINDCVK